MSSGNGSVVSDDLFPKPDFYGKQPKQTEKKLPAPAIADALSLQEEDIGLVIIKKRKEGGFVIVSDVVKNCSKQSSVINLAWGRLKKKFFKEATP